MTAAALLLHGQPGSARDWTGVVPRLERRVAAIAFDRPGWDGAGAPLDLAGNCHAAVQVLDEHGLARAIVVGHSFGAAVGAWLAVEHPDRVAALVLVAPAVNVASLGQLDRWLAAPVVGYVTSAAALSAVGAALAAAPLRRRIARRLAIDDQYLGAASRRLLTASAWRAFVHEQRTLLRDLPALEPRLAEITAPTVIVAGGQDRVVPASAVRQLARQIPGAGLRLLEQAGHLLPLQHAAALAEIVWELAGGASAQPP